MKEVPVYLAIPGTGSQLYISESNGNGEVTFDLRGYYGSGEIVAQANLPKDSAYRIDFRSPFAAEFSSTQLAPFVLHESFQQPLLAQSVSMQVQQAYFSDSLARFASPAVDSMPFYGNPDRAYLLDDYTRFTTMEEVLSATPPLD